MSVDRYLIFTLYVQDGTRPLISIEYVGISICSKKEPEYNSRALVKSVKKHSYFSTKIYAVGTQKNSLNEMVLLSTQN